MIARKLKDAAIKNKTKKSSEEWYSILDAYKEGNKNHTLMAKFLRDKFKVNPCGRRLLRIVTNGNAD